MKPRVFPTYHYTPAIDEKYDVRVIVEYRGAKSEIRFNKESWKGITWTKMGEAVFCSIGSIINEEEVKAGRPGRFMSLEKQVASRSK